MGYIQTLYKYDEKLHKRGHSPALFCAFVDTWCFGAPFDPWGKRSRLGDWFGEWRLNQLYDMKHMQTKDPDTGQMVCHTCEGPCKKYKYD